VQAMKDQGPTRLSTSPLPERTPADLRFKCG
jgi:hypothetical protein